MDFQKLGVQLVDLFRHALQDGLTKGGRQVHQDVKHDIVGNGPQRGNGGERGRVQRPHERGRTVVHFGKPLDRQNFDPVRRRRGIRLGLGSFLAPSLPRFVLPALDRQTRR